jgi:hypothetical protein
MKKIFFLSLVSIAILSCDNKTSLPKPDKLITEAELEEVLYEMAILQGAESQSRISGEDIIDTYSYIKARFGLDSLTIVQNNMYYSSDYKNYEKLNERVINRLKKLRDQTSIDSE